MLPGVWPRPLFRERSSTHVLPAKAVSIEVAARIHLVIPAHLAMSPRAQREAVVLQEAGYEVTVAGVWLDERLAEIDFQLARRLDLSFRPVVDLRAGTWRRWLERGQGRWARSRFERAGRFSPALLGYGLRAQWRHALRTRADLTIAHGEAGLWIAHQLLQERQRVGIDFEDWFSRDLPEAERQGRPVEQITQLEGTLLRDAAYRTASSGVMADALAAAFDAPRPAVVTNAVPPAISSERRVAGPLRLIWASQTIGPARGLELLFQALPLVKGQVNVTLLGALRENHRLWLERLIPFGLRHLVSIEPPVAPWELPRHVAQHDVGLVLETRGIVSRDLCLPNKLFHYFAGGLAVIGTHTRALDDALRRCPSAGLLVHESAPQELAESIDLLALNPTQLAQRKRASTLAGETIWNGSEDRETILAEAASALDVS